MDSYITKSPEETYAFGQCLAKVLSEGQVVCLEGDLGAGKTLLVQGMALSLGVSDEVTSPTFNLVNVYEGRLTIYHFDLYRLDYADELYDIGFYEYISGDGLSIIEWPNKFPQELPDQYLEIIINKSKKIDERLINVKAKGAKYQEVCKELKNSCPYLR